MHKNKIWFAFLILITLVVIWFMWGTVGKVREYFTFTSSTQPLTIDWNVHRISDEKFYLKGIYTYQVKGKTYQGETLISEPVYQNPWAAEQFIPQQMVKNWKAWYDPNSPFDSTLVKHFPMKELISTTILVGIWIYFIWLGFYVGRYNP
jgi:hypothetical protein